MHSISYVPFRMEKDPEGWATLDNGYLFCQKEGLKDLNHSKTFLTVSYKRTHHQIISIVSPESVPLRDVQTSDKSSPSVAQTAVGDIIEETFVKQEISIYVLSFDFIFNAKPLISTLEIFQDVIIGEILLKPKSAKPLITEPLKSPERNPNQQVKMTPFPILTVHFESFRIILPARDSKWENESFYDKESVLLFHLSSIDVTSCPINPLTKAVINKVLYRQIKNSYRDGLRKLKIWNVQYQIDVMNIGICTTNQHALEDSLPNKDMMFKQNPALEWNLKTRSAYY